MRHRRARADTVWPRLARDVQPSTHSARSYLAPFGAGAAHVVQFGAVGVEQALRYGAFYGPGTSVSFASAPLMPKRLGLLHELVSPQATIAWLRQPGAPGIDAEEKEVPLAARELGR
jgi:hypothetical protein